MFWGFGMEDGDGKGKGEGSFYIHGDWGRYVDSIINGYLLLKN